MGMRGPVGKKRGGDAQARLLTRVPSPARDLGAAGKAEWRRVASDLGPRGRNVLTESSLGLLEDLARAVDDAERFRKEWQEQGLTVQGKGREFGHPMIAAEREARRSINQLRRELGVTPSSAVRVPSGPAQSDGRTGFEDVE